MGQILHGSATTTEAIRRAIQNSQESLRALARRYGINPKTVAKWKKRTRSLICQPVRRSQVDGAIARRGGRHRRLSAPHAVAAGRLPLCAAADDPASDALVTASLPAAARHQPIARGRGRQAGEEEVQGLPDRLLPYRHCRGAAPSEGKLYLFVAIDRTSKFAFVELHEKATTAVVAGNSCAS